MLPNVIGVVRSNGSCSQYHTMVVCFASTMKTLTRVLYLGPEIIVEDFLATLFIGALLKAQTSFIKSVHSKWTLRDPLHPTGVDRPDRRQEGCTARWRDRRRHGATEPCPGSPRFLLPLSNLTHAGHHSQPNAPWLVCFVCIVCIVRLCLPLYALSNAGTEMKENSSQTTTTTTIPKQRLLP